MKSLHTCALLASLIAPNAHGQDQPKVYKIKSGPQTVEWGYFDAAAKPILTIRSGAIVELDTPLAGSKEMEALGMPDSLIRPAMRELEAVTDGVRHMGIFW